MFYLFIYLLHPIPALLPRPTPPSLPSFPPHLSLPLQIQYTIPAGRLPGDTLAILLLRGLRKVGDTTRLTIMKDVLSRWGLVGGGVARVGMGGAGAAN